MTRTETAGTIIGGTIAIVLQLGLLIGAPVAVYAIGGFENIFFGIVLTIVVFVAGGAALAEAAMWFEVVVYAAAAIWANRTARTIAMIVHDQPEPEPEEPMTDLPNRLTIGAAFAAGIALATAVVTTTGTVRTGGKTDRNA